MQGTHVVCASRIGEVIEHDAAVVFVQLVEGDEQAEGKGGGGQHAEGIGEEIVFHGGSNWVAFK